MIKQFTSTTPRKSFEKLGEMSLMTNFECWIFRPGNSWKILEFRLMISVFKLKWIKQFGRLCVYVEKHLVTCFSPKSLLRWRWSNTSCH